MITEEQVKAAVVRMQEIVSEKYAQMYGTEKNSPIVSVEEISQKWTRIIWSSYGSRSVYGFICMQDNGIFKAGDLMKAASWKAPAKNFARGNILTGNYSGCGWCSIG